MIREFSPARVPLRVPGGLRDVTRWQEYDQIPHENSNDTSEGAPLFQTILLMVYISLRFFNASLFALATISAPISLPILHLF